MNTKSFAWATDLGEDFSEQAKRLVKWCQNLPFQVQITPIYFSPDFIRWDAMANDMQVLKAVADSAPEVNTHLLSLSPIFKSLVFHQTAYSTSVTPTFSETIGTFLLQEHFDALILNSTGKKSSERNLLGSFSEQAVFASPIPVLIINQQMSLPQRPCRNILFPTDLSEQSHRTFLGLLDFFSESNVRIHLLSEMVQTEAAIASSMMGGMWTNIEPFPVVELARVRTQLNTWKTQAEAKGISCSTHMENLITSTSGAILDFATENEIDLIALVTQSSRIARSLFGSIGRDVVCGSKTPIWLSPYVTMH